MAVREFKKNDIPQVVDLYWGYLGSRSGKPPAELCAAFSDLYFGSPWVDPENPSFVYEDKSGGVLGFLGLLTRKMIFRGEPIRVRFGGNFVVHPSARAGVAAARLLNAMLDSDQETIFTDSANDISRRLLEKVDFQLVPPLSLHWARPLQPATYAIHAVSRTMGRNSGAAVEFLGKPVALILDSIAGSRWNQLPGPSPKLHVEELDAGTLLNCIRDTTRDQDLQPEYDQNSLEWLLRFMERNRKRGRLRKILLRNQVGKIVGWSIYYVKPGAVGEVVQLGSPSGSTADVLSALFNDASEQGVAALHGVADYQTLATLSEAGCFFTCRGGWALAHSKRSDLIDSLLRGKAWLSRLDGEWCLHPGE